MKKNIALVLVLFLAFLLVGCSKQYTYKFVNEDGTVLSEGQGEKGSKIVAPENPTKASTDQYSYEFIGWDKKVGTLEEDITFTAQYKEVTRKYTYKFVNFDGTVLKEEEVEYGTMPVAPDEPDRAETPEFSYVFTGWDKEIAKVTGDVVYTAVYNNEKNVYTYKFVNYNGAVLKSEEVEYGTMPVAPEDPTRKADEEYTYTFIGWDKAIEAVTGNVTYTAQYESIKNKYTYKFVDFDGTVLKEEEVEYGTMPVAPADPERASDEKRNYTFIGWDKVVVAVTENVTYTAQYKASVKEIKYTDLTGKKVSILGDSISTFYAQGSEMNSYYGQEGRFYYPTYCADVKTVDKTWWGQLINNTQMVLGVNNSWSGSTAIGSDESAGCSDARINTLVENGDPDIVILYLGTNDVCAGYSVTDFIAAYQTILEKVYNLCAAQVYVCTLGYSAYTGMKYTDEARIAYNTAIRKFATDNNLGVIPLDEYVVEDNYKLYLNDFLHYKYAGTTLVSQIVEKALCDFNNIEFKGTVDVEHPVPEPKGHVTIGSYNSGLWTVYATAVLLYSYDGLDKGSSYIYFYVVKITKDGDNYKVTGKKDLNVAESFEACDYYIMISSSYPSHKFFDEVSVGDELALTGEITSGNCEFTLIQ